MTWEDYKSDWSAGWNYLWSEAQDTYKAAIEADPTGYAKQIAAFMDALTGSRANLDAIKAKLPNPAVTPEDKAFVERYQALEKRYHDLAAGFYPDTAPTAKTQTGFVPLLIIAGLAIGVAAASWSVAGYEYAVNLREQTGLAAKELDARVAASKEGRTLQTSTLPPPPPPPNPLSAAKGLGTLLVGGLVVTAGVLIVPPLLKKRSS